MTVSVEARIARGVGELPADQWDALTGANPFLSHAFLTALEESGSVGAGSGWDLSLIHISEPTRPY